MEREKRGRETRGGCLVSGEGERRCGVGLLRLGGARGRELVGFEIEKIADFDPPPNVQNTLFDPPPFTRDSQSTLLPAFLPQSPVVEKRFAPSASVSRR